MRGISFGIMLFIPALEFREFISQTLVFDEATQNRDESTLLVCNRTETQRLHYLNTWRLSMLLFPFVSHTSVPNRLVVFFTVFWNVPAVLQGLVSMFPLRTWAPGRGRCPGSQTPSPLPWDTMWVSALNVKLDSQILDYTGSMKTDRECLVEQKSHVCRWTTWDVDWAELRIYKKVRNELQLRLEGFCWQTKTTENSLIRLLDVSSISDCLLHSLFVSLDSLQSHSHFGSGGRTVS